MKKNNYPENSIIYINQAHLAIKNNKKMCYGNHFFLGQIIEDIANYVCKDHAIKYYRPRYDVSIGQFLGLYETISYLAERGDYDEHFLNYDFCGKILKVLYSYYKCRIPNSFSGTLFNRHRLLFEFGQLQTKF